MATKRSSGHAVASWASSFGLAKGLEGVGGRSGSLLLGGKRADVVFGIDSERHFESPLFCSLCGHDIHHSEVLEK
jgi:hypothetical protein